MTQRPTWSMVAPWHSILRVGHHIISRFPDILRLLQRLRDEAHRFAITRHQSRHRSELLGSELDSIPGVSVKRRQALLRHFGSTEALQQSSLEELKAVPALPNDLAKAIHDYFSGRRTGG